MSDIELVLEQGETVVLEATSTVVIEQDLVTELDPQGEITLVLTEVTTEIIVQPEIVIEIEVPGLRGPQGLSGASTTDVEAASTVQAYHVVALDVDGKAFVASADLLDTASRVLGISMNAALAGETVSVQVSGLMQTPALWTAGPVFLGLAGELVTDPSLALFQLQVASAVNATTLIVRPQISIDL